MTISFVYDLFGLGFSLVPGIILCIIPLQSMLVSKSKYVTIALALFLVAAGVSVVWLYRSLLPNSLSFLLFTAFLVLNILIIVLLKSTRPHNVIFCTFMGVNCSVFIILTGLLIRQRFFPDADAHIMPPQMIPYYVVCTAAVTYIFLRLLRRHVQPILTSDTAATSMWFIWVPHAISLCIMLAISLDLTALDAPVHFAVNLLCLAMTYLTYSISGRLFVAVAQVLYANERDRRLNEALRIQEAQYSALSAYIGEIRVARHDLRYHMTAMEQYVQDGDRDKLHEYLVEYRESMPNTFDLSICGNLAVDSVLRHYLEKAKELDINVNVRLDLADCTNISTTDLCIILGNCLENAVAAASRADRQNRFIRIRNMTAGRVITIVMGNGYAGERIAFEDTFLSTKRHGKEGMGLSSIQALAQKYGGHAKFEAHGGVFKTSVILVKGGDEYS